MSYRVAFLDLDDTLYPPTSGVWNAIGERIQVFMMDRLGLSYDQATGLRRRYFEEYGTTLNGLWHNHAVDPQEYLAFVHAVPLEEMLRRDPELAGMLRELPQERVVFTNANRQHAERVLACLGITQEIDAIVDLFALEMVNKPEPAAYQRAMALAGVDDPAACVLADDLPRNLLPARSMGMTTVLVGPGPADGVADVHIQRITDLVAALPRLREPIDG
ncbi:MAG: pyrimidine 5'-nucleotidase [Actinobacteria bacterium]|nr:pyrimidine 5'-nucleotidase [Actinomycetota bacterium]